MTLQLQVSRVPVLNFPQQHPGPITIRFAVLTLKNLYVPYQSLLHSSPRHPRAQRSGLRQRGVSLVDGHAGELATNSSPHRSIRTCSMRRLASNAIADVEFGGRSVKLPACEPLSTIRHCDLPPAHIPFTATSTILDLLQGPPFPPPTPLPPFEYPQPKTQVSTKRLAAALSRFEARYLCFLFTIFEPP